ncbi:MAG: hypothetical protein AAGU74_07400 [Bacillota bacterium]
MKRKPMRVLSLLLCAAMAFTLPPGGGMPRAYAEGTSYAVTYDGKDAPSDSVPVDSGADAQGDLIWGILGGVLASGCVGLFAILLSKKVKKR